MYKEKFILFLKSLEVENPEDFINANPHIIAEVGVRIAKAAKIGGSFNRATQPDVEDGCENDDPNSICAHCNELFRLCDCE